MFDVRRIRERGAPWLDRRWLPLHLAALVCLGVSQPLLDLVGGHPAFLSSYALQGPALVGFALAVAWLPALVAALPARWLLGQDCGRLAAALAAATLWAAVGLVVLGAASRLWTQAAPPLVLAAAAAAVTVAAYRRRRGVRSFFAFLLPVLLLSPAYFLGREGISTRLLPRRAQPDTAPVARPQPVVWVVFDELTSSALMTQDFAIDAERFPNFAELAATSDHFPFAFATENETRESLPSMLSGVYVRGNDIEPAVACNFLPRLTSSHNLVVAEVVTDLAPPGTAGLGPPHRQRGAIGVASDLAILYLHWLLPATLRGRLPPIDDRWAGFAAPQNDAGGGDEAGFRRDPLAYNTKRFSHFVASLGDSTSAGPAARPDFLFHHEMLPHEPWRLLPSGQAYERPFDGPGRAEFWFDDWAALEGRARFELQARAVDRLLGRLLAALQASGRFDDAWLLVTADHGLVFGPGLHKRSGSFDDLAAGTLSVPLLVKRPGQTEGRRLERPVETVDLAATLAAELGFQLPCAADGLSLYDAAERVYEDSVFARVFGYRDRDYSAVRAALGEGIARHRRLLRMEPSEDLDALPIAGAPYRLGPYGHLVGSAAPPDIESLPLLVELERPRLYDDVDPGAPMLPARVFGRFPDVPLRDVAPGTVDPDARHLLVAARGRLIGTARLRRVDRQAVFATVVDPALLTAGDQGLSFYAVDGPPSAPVLRQLATRDRTARMDEAFATAGRVVLRQGGAYGFGALRRTAGGDEAHERVGVLRLLARNRDPHLVFTIDAGDARSLAVAIYLEAPADSELQVQYTTPEESHFSAWRMAPHPVAAGRSRVVVTVASAEGFGGLLRIDPGTLPGRYEIHELEVRAGVATSGDGTALELGGLPPGR